MISHAILTYNALRKEGFSDGIVITPSHNPPEDGGFKYNPPKGGPAPPETTAAIEGRANKILKKGEIVNRIPFEKAIKVTEFIITISSDPMSMISRISLTRESFPVQDSKSVWIPWAVRPFISGIPLRNVHGLDMEIVNRDIDPTFSFMSVDKDGKIQMDCSSPYAMAGLIELKDKFDVAFGNDTDTDRHGIVTRRVGLMNPNHYLAVAVYYLFRNRPGWKKETAVGKTLVSSSMIDRVAAHMNRKLAEVPVGFKWFVEGLINRSYGFGGEESAGASFLRKDGTVWTTDKDGIIMGLLACEVTAKTGKDPGEIYGKLEERFGSSSYERIDAPASSRRRIGPQVPLT